MRQVWGGMRRAEGHEDAGARIGTKVDVRAMRDGTDDDAFAVTLPLPLSATSIPPEHSVQNATHGAVNLSRNAGLLVCQRGFLLTGIHCSTAA